MAAQSINQERVFTAPNPTCVAAYVSGKWVPCWSDEFHCTGVEDSVQRLWLGNLKDAHNTYWLSINNITKVISVIESSEAVEQVMTDVDYVWHKMEDSFSQTLMSIYEKIKSDFVFCRGGSILMHCYAGVNRSASLIALFLYYNLDKKFVGDQTGASAMGFIIDRLREKRHRSLIYNVHFYDQLMKIAEPTCKLSKTYRDASILLDTISMKAKQAERVGSKSLLSRCDAAMGLFYSAMMFEQDKIAGRNWQKVCKYGHELLGALDTKGVSFKQIMRMGKRLRDEDTDDHATRPRVEE